MNELTVLAPEQLPAKLTREEMASALGYAESATSEGTRVAYESDWRAWVAFASARGAQTLPAAPGVVAAFLFAQADAGRKASSIGRSAAAVRRRPRQPGCAGS